MRGRFCLNKAPYLDACSKEVKGFKTFVWTAMASEDIPYWRANVPKDRWPSECPEFLLDLSERDQILVGKLDEDYHRLTWPEVRRIIGASVSSSSKVGDLRL